MEGNIICYYHPNLKGRVSQSLVGEEIFLYTADLSQMFENLSWVFPLPAVASGDKPNSTTSEVVWKDWTWGIDLVTILQWRTVVNFNISKTRIVDPVSEVPPNPTQPTYKGQLAFLPS